MEASNNAAAAGEESRESKWRRLIEEQAASGLSVKRFCAEHGVGGASFFAWRRKLAGGEAKPLPAAFVEVKAARPEPPAAAAAIELELRPDGPRAGDTFTRVLLLRAGFDPALLRSVLAALEVR